jgi:hypothetical protein
MRKDTSAFFMDLFVLINGRSGYKVVKSLSHSIYSDYEIGKVPLP